MTPPRLRRHLSSTTTTTSNQNQPVRSISGVPRTRSMAKLAASTTTSTHHKNKLTVFDENAISTTTKEGGLKTKSTEGGGLKKSTTTKNLRSRGPLKESKSISNLNMIKSSGSGSGEVMVEGKVKRKVVDDEENGNLKKMLKVEHKRSTTNIGIGGGLEKKRLNSIRSIEHKSSTESLRSIQPQPQPQPSLPSTPKNKLTFRSNQTLIMPTPARELLKKHTTSPSDSPPMNVIARPPTPPRMKERPPTSTTSTLPPVTPKRNKSPEVEKMDLDKPLSRMPASLRKTPGHSTMPSSFLNPVPFTPSHNPATTVQPSTTPTLSPSPRKVFTFPRSSTTGSTTPNAPPPPSFSRMPTALATPSMRVVPPSPLSSRMASAVKSKKESQPTLDAFFRKKESAMDVDEVSPFQKPSVPELETIEQQPLQQSSELNAKLEEHIQPDLVDGANDTVAPTENTQDVPSAVLTTTEDIYLDEERQEPVQAPLAPAEESLPSVSASAPHALSKSTSTRTLGNMGPPSRIPVSRPSNATASSIPVKKLAPALNKKPSTGLGSLPERRPSTRPALMPIDSTIPISGEKEQSTSTSPIKRKPSYPSSLGSGPLSRPTPRMVSNPIIQPRSSSNPSPTPDDDTETNGFTQTPRSVSAPMGKSRLSLSTSTREGLSCETSKSLAGLSDALNKLKSKRSESMVPPSSSSTSSSRLNNTPSINITQHISSSNSNSRTLSERPSNLTSSTSISRVMSNAGYRSRSSIHPGDLSTSSDEGTGNHIGDQSIKALLTSTNGAKCLNGVRAFVDVRTSDGEDSGRIFIDILKGLGARVFAKPTESCTHIIYKSGKQATLSWFRKHQEEQEDTQGEENENPNPKKPFIVGIKWVMECKKSGKKLDEQPYLVDITEEDVFQKRRKSMEPKSLAASQGIGLGQPSVMRQAMLDVAQARKRSLMYAPKVSSPLKKGSVGISYE